MSITARDLLFSPDLPVHMDPSAALSNLLASSVKNLQDFMRAPRVPMRRGVNAFRPLSRTNDNQPMSRFFTRTAQSSRVPNTGLTPMAALSSAGTQFSRQNVPTVSPIGVIGRGAVKAWNRQLDILRGNVANASNVFNLWGKRTKENIANLGADHKGIDRDRNGHLDLVRMDVARAEGMRLTPGL